MKDYYAILKLQPDCTKADIRRAYRVQAKALHPDFAGEKGTARFLTLKEAYEVLISSATRNHYDATRRTRARTRTSANWNYRDFLKQDMDDPDNIARLICFDLLHDEDDEAVELYENAHYGGIFSLRDHTDREDFMDFGFLLAEAYLKREAVVKAFRLLRGLAALEEEDPYFKHFYVEVLNRLSSIVRHSIPEDTDNRLRIEFLKEIVQLSYPKKEEAQLRKLLSEILSASGQYELAAKEILHACELDPKLPGLRETVEVLKSIGFPT